MKKCRAAESRSSGDFCGCVSVGPVILSLAPSFFRPRIPCSNSRRRDGFLSPLAPTFSIFLRRRTWRGSGGRRSAISPPFWGMKSLLQKDISRVWSWVLITFGHLVWRLIPPFRRPAPQQRLKINQFWTSHCCFGATWGRIVLQTLCFACVAVQWCTLLQKTWTFAQAQARAKANRRHTRTFDWNHVWVGAYCRFGYHCCYVPLFNASLMSIRILFIKMMSLSRSRVALAVFICRERNTF